MPNSNQAPLIRTFASLAIILVLVYGLYLLLHPFIVPVFLGAIVSSLFRPVYNALKKKIGSSTFSALLTVIAIILIVLIPLMFLVSLIVREISNLNVILGDSYSLDALNRLVETGAAQFGYTPSIDLRSALGNALTLVGGKTTLIIGSVIGFLGSILLTMVTTFYLLQSQDQFRKTVIAFSPLSSSDTDLIITRAREVIKATVAGNLVLIVVQAIASTIGFTVFGIASPLLLGVLYGIASLVPAIGSSLVWIPVVLYQLMLGNTLSAIGITCWAISQVILFDNYLGPRLIQRRAHLHPFLILLGVLGGVSQLGAIGFLLGPTAIALGIVGLEIMQRLWQSETA